MKIGLDFDGVISDCGQLKSEWAKNIYGVEITPEKFKRELVIESGILTSQEYSNLQKQIYNTSEIGLTMLPIDGVLEYVPMLKKEGHDLIVITSRGEIGCNIARKWLEIKGLDLPLIGVDGGSKKKYCNGLDVYIDDDLDKLIELDSVKNRYLFSCGYNKHVQIHEEKIRRIWSWKEFYEEISNISK